MAKQNRPPKEIRMTKAKFLQQYEKLRKQNLVIHITDMDVKFVTGQAHNYYKI